MSIAILMGSMAAGALLYAGLLLAVAWCVSAMGKRSNKK